MSVYRGYGGGGGEMMGAAAGAVGGAAGAALGFSGAAPAYNQAAGAFGNGMFGGFGGGGGMGNPFGGGGLPGMAGGLNPFGGIPDQMKGWARDSNLTPDNAINALGGIGGLAQQQYDATGGVNTKLNKAGDKYVKALGQDTDTYIGQQRDATNAYQGQMGNLAGAAAASGENLRGQFGVQDQAMGQLQDRAMGNAGQAMSLSEAGNVNNSQHTQARDLYNTEGARTRQQYTDEGASQEKLYEQKAQGIGKQGMAATGTLAALGAQAMAGQMGGASPMTGGQLQAMQGANMAKAGQAYARAQTQMQDMRNQGMSRNMNLRNEGLGRETDTRMGGIDRGYAESNAQYQRGQQAQGLAASMVGQRSDMQNAYQGVQQGLRQEEGGYHGNSYGAGMTQAQNQYGAQMNYQGAKLGNAQDQGAREIANIQGLYQPQMAAAGQKANIYGQYGTGMMGMYGDFAGAIGSAVGGGR